MIEPAPDNSTFNYSLFEFLCMLICVAPVIVLLMLCFARAASLAEMAISVASCLFVLGAEYLGMRKTMMAHKAQRNIAGPKGRLTDFVIILLGALVGLVFAIPLLAVVLTIGIVRHR